MSRGHEEIHNRVAALQPRSKPTDPSAEIACVELWIERADEQGERVSVGVRVYGYDGALRNDYEIVEASAEALAEPYSLDLLRRLLTSDLADAVADEMGIAYLDEPNSSAK
jgi:hypothetical protein